MTPYISQTQYGKTEDFTLQVSRGQVQGHIPVQISGYNEDVDTAWEPIWSDGTLTLPAAATVVKISSGNANDTANGTGARTVVISGLDANYNTISETVALAGQTAVNTVQSYFRINGFYVASVGTDGTAAGIIYAGTGVVASGIPATVFDQIPLGWNSRQTAAYTVPAEHTAYISYSRLTFAQQSGTSPVWGRIVTMGTNNVPMAAVSAVASNGVLEFLPRYPIRVEEKTLIMAESKGASTNNSASTIIQIVLIKNFTGY